MDNGNIAFDLNAATAVQTSFAQPYTAPDVRQSLFPSNQYQNKAKNEMYLNVLGHIFILWAQLDTSNKKSSFRGREDARKTYENFHCTREDGLQDTFWWCTASDDVICSANARVNAENQVQPESRVDILLNNKESRKAMTIRMNYKLGLIGNQTLGHFVV